MCFGIYLLSFGRSHIYPYSLASNCLLKFLSTLRFFFCPNHVQIFQTNSCRKKCLLVLPNLLGLSYVHVVFSFYLNHHLIIFKITMTHYACIPIWEPILVLLATITLFILVLYTVPQSYKVIGLQFIEEFMETSVCLYSSCTQLWKILI
jgi:hypothetical protein